MKPEHIAKLYQPRPEDRFPVGSDKIMQEAWGPIPAGKLFQNLSGVFEEPARVFGWQYSITFGRWGAFVEFPNGQEVYTFPKTW